MRKKITRFLLVAMFALASLSTFVQAQCPIPIITGGSTSGNARAPIGNFRYERGHYLITAAELASAGFSSGTSISSIVWTYSTPASIPVTGDLAVYFENSSDANDLKSATWATAIAPMTNSRPLSSYTLPGTPTTSYTVPITTPFLYTGGSLYIAFEWSNAANPLSTGAVVQCNTVAPPFPGLYSAQSNIALPATLTLSNSGGFSFRPVTTLIGTAPANDAGVVIIHGLGNMAVGYNTNYAMRAVISNLGTNTLTNLPVTLNVSGSNAFTDVQTITSLAPCATTTVTFAPFTPTTIGSNTVAVSVPTDDNLINNSSSYSMTTSKDITSFRYNAPITGGVGFTGATGDFLGKFTSANNFGNSDTLNGFEVIFTTTGQPYNVGIWTDVAGSPGVNIYTSPNQTTVADTVFISLPDIEVSGSYWIGIRQTGLTNVGFGFQAENPVRSTEFKYTSPTGGTVWTDFSPGANFRISATVQYKTPQPPNCAVYLSPANAGLACQNGVTLNYGSGGGGPTGYRVYFGTNQSLVEAEDPGTLVQNNGSTSYATGALSPSTTYYWRVTAYNLNGDASGCATQSRSFTTNLPSCYCTSTATNGTFEHITNVQSGVFSNPTGSNLYSNYTGLGAINTAVINSTFNITVTLNPTQVYDEDRIYIFADFNQNGNWGDLGELCGNADVTIAGGNVYVVTCTVPVSALAGNTLLRIKFGDEVSTTAMTNDPCQISYTYGEVEDYLLNVAACTGTPDPGSTVSDVNGICPAGTFSLSLSNTFAPFGLSYQWQSGPSATGPWTNIGTNAATYSGTQSTATWYQCVVTCIQSTLSMNSVPVQVAMYTNPAPYLSLGDTSLCSNVTGVMIHVLDSGAFSGGYPPFTTFEWVNYTPATINLDSLFANSTDNYSVIVTLPANIGGCFSTTAASFINFGAADAPLPVLSQNNVNCYGESNGSAVVTIASGVSPMHNYKWYNSSNLLIRNVTVADSTDTLANVAAGVYRVEVTNSVGTTQLNCYAVDSIEVLQPSAPLSATAGTTSVSCNGSSDGSVTVSATGGTAPYQYDAGNGNQGSNVFSGLSQGSYTVTVTDDNGCTFSVSATVTEPALLTANCSVDNNAACNGGSNGSVSVVGGGGTAPYTYLWSNGGITASISGLTAGEYCVTITDANGCIAVCCATVTEPTSLTIGGVVANVKCRGAANGTITLAPSGGTAPYSYFWNNGTTNGNRSGLAPGTYCVTVTDNNGCSGTACYTISQPTTLLLNVSKTNVRCGGKCTGYANAAPTGGWGGYTYLWSTGETTGTINNLCAGTYTLTVTDAGGCVKSTTFSISQSPILVVAAVPTSLTSAIANASGGTPPYSYFWNSSPLQYTVTATGLTPGGTYKVRVTDSKNCSKIATVTLPLPKTESADANLEVVAFPNPTDGIVTLQFNTVSGFEYVLSVFDATGRMIENRSQTMALGFNSSQFDFSYLPKGIYMAVIRSDKGNANIRIVLE